MQIAQREKKKLQLPGRIAQREFMRRKWHTAKGGTAMAGRVAVRRRDPRGGAAAHAAGGPLAGMAEQKAAARKEVARRATAEETTGSTEDTAEAKAANPRTTEERHIASKHRGGESTIAMHMQGAAPATAAAAAHQVGQTASPQGRSRVRMRCAQSPWQMQDLQSWRGRQHRGAWRVTSLTTHHARGWKRPAPVQIGVPNHALRGYAVALRGSLQITAGWSTTTSS